MKEIKPDLFKELLILLDDIYRSGTPRTYSADQICLIIAISTRKVESFILAEGPIDILSIACLEN